VTVAAVTVLPNLVAAVFNFLYNRGEILERIPSAEPTFMRIQTIINLIAFPTGAACAGWLAGSVGKATRGLSNSAPLAPQRHRCLDLGNLAAVVGLTLWLIAAPAYPVSLHLMLGDVPTAVYVHFVASLALCGLIAAAYPFFAVTLVAVRSLYPSLLRGSVPPGVDVAVLNRLLKQSWLYLTLAASVPMMAVMVLVLSGQTKQFALIALAAGGTLGFALAVSAFRAVQADLTILLRVAEREE
jgi:eukaryotic-like serine/threonine-protein kinase